MEGSEKQEQDEKEGGKEKGWEREEVQIYYKVKKKRGWRGRDEGMEVKKKKLNRKWYGTKKKKNKGSEKNKVKRKEGE